MNVLILNRESLSLPGDGWYQVAPLGEFPYGASGVVQVVDGEGSPPSDIRKAFLGQIPALFHKFDLQFIANGGVAAPPRIGDLPFDFGSGSSRIIARKLTG